MVAGQAAAGNLGTLTLTASKSYWIPFLGSGQQLAAIGFHVSAAAAASSARIALYASSANGPYPTTKIAESGSISTATTGDKLYGLTSVTPTAGAWYWLVLVCNGAPTVSSISASTMIPLLGHSMLGTASAQNNPGVGWRGTDASAVASGFASTAPTDLYIADASDSTAWPALYGRFGT